MRVRCYFDGAANLAREVNAEPARAAEIYTASVSFEPRPRDVVVVPIDDEARALPEWMTEGHAPNDPFRLFRVTPRPVVWDAEEVETFNTTRSPR